VRRVPAGQRTRVCSEMPEKRAHRLRLWLGYSASAWAVLFAAPHVWWALGAPAGFPGGEASYRTFMSSRWLYFYNLAVIALCIAAVVLTLKLIHSSGEAPRRHAMRTAIWLGSGALLIRGIAGLVVDGASDPVWWPTFLVGGVLFGVVAWFTRQPEPEVEHPHRTRGSV
jgi:hypothetical protein